MYKKLLVTAKNGGLEAVFGIAIALTANYIFAVNVVLLAIKMALTLQILHASDFESGIDAAGTSPETY
ncbi:hypothetical protein VF14_30155 [Nostoc linckia z18]|uniref:Uncharacterized protein n=2 Tax=Nostoc linckia TaxID=92942 RepID=A0A9Q6EIE4_NOSLI|nr:hypothetical protein [Nostoc linckia]PHK37198.1 hypothetical protein VF12_20285 [Nostoc linckia z15]PHK43226.1 hypothetical protein VF13_28330 [Nostoc linckia z16]PHJ58703.1 hypothetical protein VF02_26780 [Nostoc linckia z1]PHJ60167.1 hypothetical protein VF03_33640 [Nostoc linckia z2]PHJ64066.1 hypothetical protein VF05_23740 [Nostoc linckia z3]